MNDGLKRRIVPIGDYSKFKDGWSRDLLMGLSIREDGVICDARLGDVYEDGDFYDAEGSYMRATHVMFLGRDDIRLNEKSISLKKVRFFLPTKEQVDSLARIVKKIPENKPLKELLYGLRKCQQRRD